MNKALKKAISIGVSLSLMLCFVLTSTVSAFADYVDGTYGVWTSCTGGSGRGGVESAAVSVSGGAIYGVTLTMTSANYDYAYDPVTGAKIYADAGSGKSQFWINYPGTYFNFTADTTAMSEPHEITYTVSIDISGIPTVYVPSPEEIARAELEKKLAAADALIEAIGNADEVSFDSEEAIKAARAAVDELTEDEQKELTKLDILKAAETKYDELMTKVTAVDTLIENIGEVSLESEESIKAARDAVEALSSKEKLRLTKLSVLNDAEETLEKLQEAAAIEAAAKAAARKRAIIIGAAVAAVLMIAVVVVVLKKKKR